MSRNLYDGLLNPDVKTSRNGFDLSHRKLFTAKAGELLPILCEEMIPSDYFEVDTATLLRSFPLNTAAFLRCKMVFDFFFVPKTAIWSRWQDFINQRKDLRSSYVKNSLFEPNITLSKIAADCAAPLSGSDPVVNGSGARQKIAQLLGYGCFANGRSGDSRSLTALPIYGYNFIYNHWYRNPWNDEPDSVDIEKSNADNLQCSTYANSLVDTIFQGDTRFINMHYRGWNKDLFMGSLPNQQFNKVSSVLTQSSFDLDISTSTSNDKSKWVDGGLQGSATGVTDGEITTYNGNFIKANDGNWYDWLHTHTLSVSEEDIPFTSEFNVLQLRRALAMQKWKEYNMRAGYRGSNQQRAQFGVPLPSDKRHELDFIDSYEQWITIDEIISTNGANSETNQGNLGEIGGKGISYNSGKKIKYTANQHGYLYCIFSVVPISEYDAVGIDKQLVRSTPFDHFYPAFENLGLQPIQAYQLNDLFVGSSYRDKVIGYAPYAYEYKTRNDKVYGELAYVNGIGQGGSLVAGQLNAWSSHRVDIYGQDILQGSFAKENFYIIPSVLDTCFLSSADATQSTDQFIVDVGFETKAIRPMSVLGLPQF